MSKTSRKYEASIERALALFDTTSEWADYIAFLSRLHRALQGGPDGTDIPLKQTVAKCLAHCLTPALPSGVHQKALEIYACIFSKIGKDQLAKDLALYLPGVSHTLSFGSLSVRPLFLLLIRDHVLCLPIYTLRPALKAILLSLLPGLEDESTEDFETTLATVSQARIIFERDGSEGFFWQSLFLVTITSPNRRPGAFIYLVRNLPKLPHCNDSNTYLQNGNGALEDSTQVILSPEPGLLMRCFAAGLLDEQILVQRNFLDLLVTHLPIGALTESKLVLIRDVEILVSAALSVVLRRDMSLNKRLWAWFQGPGNDDSTEAGAGPVSPNENKTSKQLADVHLATNDSKSYFRLYSLAPLTQSIIHMINQESRPTSELARPYRIALSLMDKWEIGGAVIAATFVPLMRNLQSFRAAALTEEAYGEVFRSANVFFNGVESNLIWTQLFRLYEQNEWDLIEFVVSSFSLEEEEMLILHLPLFAILLWSKLATKDDDLDIPYRRPQIQRILVIVMTLIPEQAYEIRSADHSEAEDNGSTGIRSIKTFYNTQDHNGRAAKPPFPRHSLRQISLQMAAKSYLQYLSWKSTSILEITQAFVVLISKTPGARVLYDFGLLTKIDQHFQVFTDHGLRWTYLSSSSVTSMLVALSMNDKAQLFADVLVETFIRYLTTRFWHLLSPSSPQYHVDAVQHILSLHAISEQNRDVESTIVSLITDPETPGQQRLDRYNVLWNLVGKELLKNLLQKPLLCVVDLALLQEPCDPARSWIRNLPITSLETIYRLVFKEDHENQLSRALGLLNIQTEEQWLALGGEAGQTTRSTLSASALKLLGAAQNKSLPVEYEHKELLEALSLLQVLQSHGVLTVNEDKLSSVLLKSLQESPEGSLLQYALIEALQELAIARSLPYPPEVLAILLKGIASTVDESVDHWVTLTCAVIMLYNEDVFQVLLKVTDCFCTRLDSCLISMQDLFNSRDHMILSSPEKLIINLLSGLEYVLIRAHQRLGEREKQNGRKSPDQPQGLFGAIGSARPQAVTEEKQLRRSFANDHLTVVLCFQDAVKLCHRYWSWGTASHVSSAGTQASHYHYASKIRSRSRRMLDNLLEAELQECLETLIGLWTAAIRNDVQADSKRVLNLLQSLKGGRPRLTLPATFNTIYNRTNPAVLDHSQRSTMSTSLSATELACFLVEYTSSLEDDLVEEIWTDCTTFLREVLGNPMPHRQILLHMLEFIAVLCKKIENTNFGEEYKMRRELGDITLRLFTAIFTLKPGNFDAEPRIVNNNSSASTASPLDSRSLMQVLCMTLPALGHVLTESDRFATVLNGIGLNITGPLFRSKGFPQNISLNVLVLLQAMSKPTSSSKAWRKDVLEAFNDTKFFGSPVSTVKPGWLPLIRQMLLADRSLLLNTLSQLTIPTTAGIMFGVGATAARTEADRRTQAALRRIALLFVAADMDAFAGNIAQVHTKIEQLLVATQESSPSSAICGDIYMLLRAMVLQTSPIHLPLLWPTIDAELRDVLLSLTMKDSATKYSAAARLQAAKLLDLLLLLRPDEFQLHEWLFVTDTVDAIYPPADFVPSSLSDMVARTVNAEDDYLLPTTSARRLRKPWLCSEVSREILVEEIDAKLLQPFFRQLSIHAFEDVYSLGAIDKEACVDDLIADLFSS